MLLLKVLIALIAGKMSQQQVANGDESGERPFLRIVAPKFLCGRENSAGNQSDSVDNSNELTIALQTREGQKLRFQISVDFELIDGGFVSQRHTLSIWRNVRNLKKKFFDEARNISEKNQIELDANELTPQVVYTFRVTGIDEANRTSETQNVTITYKNGEIKTQRKDSSDGVSLLLFAPATIYVDMEFLAVAEVLFCDAVNEYTYEWKLGNELQSRLKGKILQLPTNFYNGEILLSVEVKVLNTKAEVMGSAGASVRFIARNVRIQNIPVQASVGINREIPIEVVGVGGQNFKIDEIQSICSMDGSNECPAILSGQHVTFPSTGIYRIETRLITSGNITKLSSSTRIEVDARVIPHVRVKHFPVQPINVMQTNQIVVTILDLVPNCVASWHIHDDKISDLTNFTDLGTLVVKDLVENFLSEIADYDNSTLSKDISLTIKSDLLEASNSYNFRLSIACPEPVTSSDSAKREDAKRTNVTSYFDIVLMTNAPPICFALDVSPSNGVAMLDEFKFTTGSAKDESSDFPLLYTFGYVFGNVDIVIGTFYENSVARTQLPYSDEIATYFEVCDNNKACRRVDGPKIAANLTTHKHTREEIEFKLAEFEMALQRADYSDGLNAAAVLLLTVRKAADSGSSKIEEQRIMESMKKEINRLKQQQPNGTKDDLKRNIDFVEMSRRLTSFVNFDESLIKEILSLDERNSSSAASRVKRTSSKSAEDQGDLSLAIGHMKNILTLSGMLFNSKNTTLARAEKQNFFEKVHQSLPTLCGNKNLNAERIDVNYMSLEVSKVFTPQLFADSQQIPGDASIMFSRNSNFPQKFVCIAKIRFDIDFFSASQAAGAIYETAIFDKNDESNLFDILSANKLSDFMMIELPSNDSSKSCLILKSTSSIWSENSDCTKMKSSSEGKILCKCSTSGVDKVLMKLNDDDNQIKQIATTKNPGISASSTTSASAAVTELEITTTMTSLPHSTASVNHVGNVSTTLEPNVTSPEAVSTTPSSNTVTSNATQFTSLATETSPATSTAVSYVTTSSTTIRASTARSDDDVATTRAVASQNDSSTSHASTTTLMTSTSSTFESPHSTEQHDTSTTAAVPTSPSSDIRVNKTINSTNSTTNEEIMAHATVSWTMISFLLGLFALIVTLFLIYACRQYAFPSINLPMRNPTDGIRYAKYHDEFSLRG